MGTTAEPGGKPTPGVAKLGLAKGMVVQELGWDADVDEALRGEIMDFLDDEFVDEPVDAVDLILLWWRDEDGDLVDGLVDSLPDLADSGTLWLMTPKVGRSGYVDPSDLAEGALTAGLSLTKSAAVSRDWQAHKLVRPKGGRR